MKKHQVVLLEANADVASRYGREFEQAGLGVFKIIHVPAAEQVRKEGFDALYWPLAGAERWNVLPINDVVQVVETDDEHRRDGWPPHLFVGLALSEPNAVDSQRRFRAWGSAVLAALRQTSAEGIANVKVPTEWTRLTDLTPQEAADILRLVEREELNEG